MVAKLKKGVSACHPGDVRTRPARNISGKREESKVLSLQEDIPMHGGAPELHVFS